MITAISKCSCGAVTIWFDNGATNSMFQETFEQLKLDIISAEQLPESYSCDHCANHWGIDLCECGSGERVGKCHCGSNIAHDNLGVRFDSFGAILKTFSNIL